MIEEIAVLQNLKRKFLRLMCKIGIHSEVFISGDGSRKLYCWTCHHLLVRKAGKNQSVIALTRDRKNPYKLK